MKKNYYILLVLILLFQVFVSCDHELEITSDREDSILIYGLFNLRDTIQYIRIGKSFQTSTDISALDAAKKTDSIYPDPNKLIVELEVWKNDQLIEGPFILERLPNCPKDTGFFANTGNLVYQFKQILIPECSYKLIVTDLERNQTIIATSELLGNRDYTYAFHDHRVLHIRMYSRELIDYNGSLDYLSNYIDRVIRFHYYDIEGDDWEMRYVDWQPYFQPQGYQLKSDSSELQFSDEYLKFLAQNIPVIPGITRKAVGVDYMVTLAGDELRFYLQNCNNPDVFHYLNYFSNIENGLGIFSSRYYYTFFAEHLTQETIDTLVFGIYTKQLNFIDSPFN